MLEAIAAILGCLLIALGIVMGLTRQGYMVFVVGPRSVLALAALVGLLALAVHWR